MSELESKLISRLLEAKKHLREMQVRRADYTPAEMLGHFTTHLRRLDGTYPFSQLILWKAPFEPIQNGWPVNVFHDGVSYSISFSAMKEICAKVLIMDESEIDIGRSLLTLTSISLPKIEAGSVDLERLTRKLEILFSEAATFSLQQETA